MQTWEDTLYNAKKDFYSGSVISPAHIKLRKALDIVEKEIKPISRELEEKKKENEQLKATLADASTQLRLALYQQNKEVDQIKNEFADRLVERLKEKDEIFQTLVSDYEERIKALQDSVNNAQAFNQELQSEKREIEYSSTQHLQKILDNDRLENTLIHKRKDEEIQAMQDRLIQKEDAIKTLMHDLNETEIKHADSQKQWIKEVQFSREILKKTIEEMDALQHEYVKRESEVIKDLQSQIMDSRKHLAHLETDLPYHREQMLQIELTEKTDLLKRYEHENTALQEMLIKAQTESEPIEKVRTEKQQFRDRIAELEKTNMSLVVDVDSLHARLGEYEDQLIVYKQKIADAKAHPAEPAVNHEETVKAHEAEKAQIEKSFKQEQESLQNQIEKNKQTISELTRKLSLAEARMRHESPIPVEALIDTNTAHFNFIPDLPIPETTATQTEETAGDETKIKSMPKRIFNLRNAGIAVLSLFLVSTGYFLFKHFIFSSLKQKSASHSIDQSFKAPQQNPSTLIWDGLAFWSTDWYTKKIFKHKPHSLADTVQSFELDSIIPTSMTWGEGSLWVSDAWARKIYRLSSDTGFDIESVYASPGRLPTGLAWDGQYLWSCDASTQEIYRHDPAENLNIVQSFLSPDAAPAGLLWDGDTLWSCDSDTGMIYRHRMDNELSVASAYQPRDFQDGRDKLIGFTWDGKYFWTVGEQSGRFYRHSIHDMIKQ